MKYCPICRNRYPSDKDYCPVDGMRLFQQGDTLSGKLLLGRYKLQEQIGAGGMALVHRAIDKETGDDVAVKVLRRELVDSSEQRIRFLREARAARGIRHPNIVEIYDIGETDDGLVFMVLEYLAGSNLGRLMDRQPLSRSRCVSIVMEVALALKVAHEHGVIHRDIKPENIFVLEDEDGNLKIKLLDFGLARIRGDLSLTNTGQVYGTPEYMSPEQATGKDAVFASDQYALGAMFYELLVGQPPFKGDPGDVLLKHYKETPTPPSEVGKGVGLPSMFDAVILRMLAKHPDNRLDDDQALITALGHLQVVAGA